MIRLYLSCAGANAILFILSVRWVLQALSRGMSVYDSGFAVAVLVILVEGLTATLFVVAARQRWRACPFACAPCRDARLRASVKAMARPWPHTRLSDLSAKRARKEAR